MAQLSDTVRLRNLAVSLDGVKVVGYQHQIMKDYQQIENDETNNIIGEFNSLDKNVARYCETNNSLSLSLSFVLLCLWYPCTESLSFFLFFSLLMHACSQANDGVETVITEAVTMVAENIR